MFRDSEVRLHSFIHSLICTMSSSSSSMVNDISQHEAIGEDGAIYVCWDGLGVDPLYARPGANDSSGDDSSDDEYRMNTDYETRRHIRRCCAGGVSNLGFNGSNKEQKQYLPDALGVRDAYLNGIDIQHPARCWISTAQCHVSPSLHPRPAATLCPAAVKIPAPSIQPQPSPTPTHTQPSPTPTQPQPSPTPTQPQSSPTPTSSCSSSASSSSAPAEKRRIRRPSAIAATPPNTPTTGDETSSAAISTAQVLQPTTGSILAKRRRRHCLEITHVGAAHHEQPESTTCSSVA